MGFWEAVYYTGDFVKGITPDISSVKREAGAAYRSTSAAVAKIDQVIRVDGIQKLPQYWPDDETIAHIALFSTKLANNVGKYAVDEARKHPVVSVASKLVSDTMLEVKQQNQKDGILAKMDKLERDLMKSTQNEISYENVVGGGSQKTNDMINTFMKSEFVGNHMFRDLIVHKMARMENKNE